MQVYRIIARREKDAAVKAYCYYLSVELQHLKAVSWTMPLLTSLKTVTSKVYSDNKVYSDYKSEKVPKLLFLFFFLIKLRFPP